MATNLSGILTVSVPGVSAWRGVIPVLAGLAPRTVHLAFDADAATNPLVARAAEATAKAVALEGYDVLLEGWDRMLAKGIDDALVAELPIQLVPVQVLGHSDPAEPIAREVHPRATGRHAYKSTQAGLIWERPTQNGPVVVPLTNFRALIATDVLEDDGAEVRRRFELEARLNGWCRRFTVTAEAFAAMGWVTEHLGARAIVYPGLGLRDHARAAVQVLSGEVPERHVYSHTGWRQLPGGWAYLHGRGAIGPGGPVPGVEVDLPDALTGFALPDPPSGAELVAAVRASLRLVDVAPDHIAFPLLGAAYRAVLGEVEFALHLAGPTGVGKSELAALIQRHFGPDLDARHLPGYWSSTANALELLAFSAKDALLVVDDFAPTSNQGDVDRAHREADRVLRAQGNRSGRLRMRGDGTLRAVKPPRGLILSTGEDVPRGQSIRARLLTCELGPDDLVWPVLSACQMEAAEGRPAQALAGFLRWIAPQRDALREQLGSWLPNLRERAAGSATHRRTPEIVANLATGWGFFLSFALSAEAITEERKNELWSRTWDALGRAVVAQAHHERGGDPALRFMELLGSAIASGRAHLAGVEDHGSSPGRPGRLGVAVQPARRVGAQRRPGRLAWGRGPRLPRSRRLIRRGAAVRPRSRGSAFPDATDATQAPQGARHAGYNRYRSQVLTVRRTLEGQRREVLHLSSSILSSSEPSTAGRFDFQGPHRVRPGPETPTLVESHVWATRGTPRLD